jgi:hypothetical protein
VEALQGRGDFFAADDEMVEVDRAVGFDGDRERAVVDITALLRLRQLHIHAIDQRRQHDHEDDQQHETDIDKRSDVDVGVEGRRASRAHEGLLVRSTPFGATAKPYRVRYNSKPSRKAS